MKVQNVNIKFNVLQENMVKIVNKIVIVIMMMMMINGNYPVIIMMVIIVFVHLVDMVIIVIKRFVCDGYISWVIILNVFCFQKKIQCQSGSFGRNCVQDCPLCMHSNQTCNPVNGSCLCLPGYSGFFCEKTCQEGTFGHECRKKCDCSTIGGQCDHETGKCICYPGWQGSTCTKKCDEDTYGLECRQHCKCQNGATCRATDGVCFCKDGYMGTLCSEICPDGFYGTNCLLSCECPLGNYVCDPVIGCTCKLGFTGKNCEMFVTIASAQQIEEISTGSSIGFWLLFFIMAIFATTMFFIYYRKRLNIKDLSYYVQYFNHHSSMEPRHFDNPVYSSTSTTAAAAAASSSMTTSSSGLLNNCTHINNGFSGKNINLIQNSKFNDFEKPSLSSTTFGIGSSSSNHYEVPNNNVYHTIDEEKSKLSDKISNLYHTIDEMNQIKISNNDQRPIDNCKFLLWFFVWLFEFNVTFF